MVIAEHPIWFLFSGTHGACFAAERYRDISAIHMESREIYVFRGDTTIAESVKGMIGRPVLSREIPAMLLLRQRQTTRVGGGE